jgi:VCBS repeat-containing protein
MDLDGGDLRLGVQEEGAVYPITIDPFVEQVKLLAGDGAAEDGFGQSVAISGGTVIVGAPGPTDQLGNCLESGAAYIFERTPGSTDWAQASKLTASDGVAGDCFGGSVAVDGHSAVVGARRAQGSVGRAYIFERDAGGSSNWIEAKKLNPTDFPQPPRFGTSVAIGADTVVVGAPFFRDSATFNQVGAVYIFERNRSGINNWGLARKRLAISPLGPEYGDSVSISGDTAVVGAPRYSPNSMFSAGAAYILERNRGGASNWGQVTVLVATDATDNDRFGASVSISGDTAIVGADADDGDGPDSGAAYIFERGPAGQWTEVRKLIRSDPGAADGFGSRVSISGATAVVGASGHDPDGRANAGAAYLFDRHQGGPDNWGQVGPRLLAGDAAADDRFGVAVSISSATVVVGASHRDDLGLDSGAAYVFMSDPAATDDSYSVNEDTALDVPTGALFGVLANDSDPGGAPLTALLVGGPSHGTLTLNADGSFSYLPDADFVGTDTFTYKAVDGGGVESNTATVAVAVSAVNDPPSFTGTDRTVNEDAPRQVVSGWATAISAGALDEVGQTLVFLVSNDNNGLFSEQPAVAPNGTLTYRTALNANGSATLTVQLRDNGGTLAGGLDTSAPQSFTITVNPVNDPPSPIIDRPTTAEDTAVDIDVLANDGDPDAGDTLTVNAVIPSASTHGSVSINADGTVRYIPAANYFGPASFRYNITDGNLVSLFNATVDVTVTPVHDNPVANADAATVPEDQRIGIDVLANDALGPDGGALAVVAVGKAANGTVTINPLGTGVIYQPKLNFAGSDAFKYVIADGSGGQASAVVSVTVAAVNDPPVNTVPAGPQTVAAINSPLVFSAATGNAVSIADVDADPRRSLMRVTLSATGGTVSLSGTAGLTFAAGDGRENVAMTFVGTIASINVALEGMVFTRHPSLGASLTIMTDDQGNSGAGGALQDIDTLTFGLPLP